MLTAANFDHVPQGRDVERPDVLQQMLLAGIAVDSPADAAALHPGHFRNANEAKMAFGRAAFKGQTPIYTSYREMSLNTLLKNPPLDAATGT